MMRELFARDSRSEEQKRDWVRRFESPGTRRAILGTNHWAKSVASHLTIDYFIDDFTASPEFCGRPIVRSIDAEKEVATLSAVVGVRPLSARDVLRKTVDSHLDYFSFMRHTTLAVDRIPYLSDEVDWSLERSASLGQLRELLYDEVSRETFDRVVALRRDLDIESMVVFSDRQDEQYFEPFIRLAATDIFLDVGAFDGFTTDCLRQIYGEEVDCLLFEPNPKMANLLRQKFKDDVRLKIHECALADKSEVTLFIEDGSTSRVGPGDTAIKVETLDSFALEKVDLIKVDIEGAEASFIEGARQTLARCQPQVAIACYHSNAQLGDVFRRLNEIMPDARVYLRHYTEGFVETDLFFVPPRFW